MSFSARLPKDLSPSAFAVRLQELKGKGPYVDLTVSSPTQVGLLPNLTPYFLGSLQAANAWDNSSAGALKVREAVCEYYASRGGRFDSDQILLTSSTSEAYSFLLKTFCDPGDVVLTATPGYPLLDTLASLEHLSCYPYFLKWSAHSRRFAIDLDSLLSAPEKAKVLFLVSPHNPTGYCVSEADWAEIIRFCEERSLVLVVDEVFGDFVFNDVVYNDVVNNDAVCNDAVCNDGVNNDAVCNSKKRRSFELNCGNVAVFWLNGLSKTVGAPHLKLSWMAFTAPKKELALIQEALSFVADAYLSVSSWVQAMAPALLKDATLLQEPVRLRLQENLKILTESCPSAPVVDGGWYAALYLGEVDDEQFVLQLLEEHRILVQPGFYFDFDGDGWVVFSLLSPPKELAHFFTVLKKLKITSTF